MEPIKEWKGETFDNESYLKAIEKDVNDLVDSGAIKTIGHAQSYIWNRLGFAVSSWDMTPIKVWECAKCGVEMQHGSDVLILERKGKTVTEIYLCEDCSEKALIVLADALELPDWD